MDFLKLKVLVAFWITCTLAVAAPAPPPQPPSVIYGELFEAVQRANIFADSKSFPDAIPQVAPNVIMDAYRAEHRKAGFDLRAFVAQYFEPPEMPDAIYKSDRNQSVCAHIDALWPVLTRGPDAPGATGSLLPLPYRYVVPGGRFREIYYWDSYFTMLGLEASGRHDIVDAMLQNFAYLIDTYGHVPNGNRTYYLSRSQPPFFAAMVRLVAKREGQVLYAKYLPQLTREYNYWMEGQEKLTPGTAHRRVVRLVSGEVLNRYWDDRAVPRDEAYREDVETARASRRDAAEVYRNLRAAAESGWDFSSRWLADGRTLSTIRTVDLLPVDLNSLMYDLEVALSRAFLAAGADIAARKYRAIADERARAIRRIFWNEERHIFTDYLWKERKLSDAVTAAGTYPLFFDIATRDDAAQVARTVRMKLLRPEGIVPTALVSGQQWDAPNGWPPLQWIAVEGLRRSGEGDLAAAIARGWIRENVDGFRRTGKLVEKYDVTGSDTARGGEYPTQDGFGWTNGVLRLLLDVYPHSADCAEPTG
ncbi:MAG TPA: alpha,alpha-trehalase TreA [Steroidobacteraceae bacterium]|nr:alpha,alpha-trehalase TreA [Steroidobacteraceae bacterium]